MRERKLHHLGSRWCVLFEHPDPGYFRPGERGPRCRGCVITPASPFAEGMGNGQPALLIGSVGEGEQPVYVTNSRQPVGTGS